MCIKDTHSQKPVILGLRLERTTFVFANFNCFKTLINILTTRGFITKYACTYIQFNVSPIFLNDNAKYTRIHSCTFFIVSGVSGMGGGCEVYVPIPGVFILPSELWRA